MATSRTSASPSAKQDRISASPQESAESYHYYPERPRAPVRSPYTTGGEGHLCHLLSDYYTRR